MRIALLSRAANRLYSNRRLAEAAKQRGHELEHVHTLNCYMEIDPKSPRGEFRSNLHRGGKASIVKLSPDERKTAVRSAKKMGLNVAGVDLLRSDRGPMVMEVNSSPGLEGIEKATGKDIAGMIIQFLENHAKQHKTRTRGKG